VTIFSDAPAKLLATSVVTALITIFLSIILVWHGMRRALDVPRIPKPAGMYWALAIGWGIAATGCLATVMTAFLLRDHTRVAGRTPIGKVRCEMTAKGRVRLEVDTGPALLAGREVYDLDGDACRLSVRQIELRPGLEVLGVPALARVDGVGPSGRPAMNPAWLRPETPVGNRVLGLVVRQTRAMPVVVPADPKQQFLLVATPDQQVVLQPSAT
jgi:hypothetical protein